MDLSMCTKFGRILRRTVKVKPGTDGQTDTQTHGADHSIQRHTLWWWIKTGQAEQSVVCIVASKLDVALK